MAGLIAGPVAGVIILIAIVSCVITIRRRAQIKKHLSMKTALISPFPNTAPASDKIGRKPQQPVVQHERETKNVDLLSMAQIIFIDIHRLRHRSLFAVN